MLPYWILFALPAVGALRERATWRQADQPHLLLLGLSLLFVLVIGFRYQVGGDWQTYLFHLDQARYLSFAETFAQSDPGYALLNWLAARTFGEIWGVNLVCGAIFSAGLLSFAKAQPRPWLALLVAVPYLIIVIAMGYTRQGVAIGLAMLGLVALVRKRSALKFVLWMALAATFHKTALLLVPIAALSVDRGRFWTALWVGGSTLLLYYLFLEDSVNPLMAGYLEAEYNSQGAAIRVAMNLLPALLFLLLRRRFSLSRIEFRLWTNISILALVFVILLVVSPSSTAVDRMALYLIPLQLFVLSRLPEAFPASSRGVNQLALAVIAYSAAVQFTWLNFATHARYWVPYQVFPLL